MKRNRLYGVSAATAAIVALVNIGGVSAADNSANLFHRTWTAEVIGKPSIHNAVMDELMREKSPDPLSKAGDRASMPSAPDASTDIPTSMLWPADKYLPQLTKFATG